MTVQIIRGNALHLPIADETVDLVCTSPPYFGLRSYQDGGQHYAGQLGSEATPAEFVAALLAATAEMVRVLKPSGSIWVNLGDKYSGNEKGTPWTKRALPNDRTIGGSGYGNQNVSQPRPQYRSGLPPKSLMGIPWRYALACIDQLGLILRAEIIWNKPNGLPESVTDRVRRSHEQWFHLVKQPRYYSAVDEIREEHDPKYDEWHRRYAGRYERPKWNGTQPGVKPALPDTRNPLGKLPGSVWTIPTEPLTVPPELGVDHFAAFPTEWPRRIIQGWTPPGICQECGQGRRPVVDKTYEHRQNRIGNKFTDGLAAMGTHGKARPGSSAAPDVALTATITGYVCGCPTPDAPTHPSVVLDPFGGTGTTCLVADVLGRHGIHIDLSHDYNRLARWRIHNPDQRAKAARVDKPPAVIDGQLSLLDGGMA